MQLICVQYGRVCADVYNAYDKYLCVQMLCTIEIHLLGWRSLEYQCYVTELNSGQVKKVFQSSKGMFRQSFATYHIVNTLSRNL